MREHGARMLFRRPDTGAGPTVRTVRMRGIQVRMLSRWRDGSTERPLWRMRREASSLRRYLFIAYSIYNKCYVMIRLRLIELTGLTLSYLRLQMFADWTRIVERAAISLWSGSSTWSTADAHASGSVEAEATLINSPRRTSARLTASNRQDSVIPHLSFPFHSNASDPVWSSFQFPCQDLN